ncbi:tRNA (guanine37-N1)-methyltransferase [Catalinimonas alkaloidigena]|uniref:tRNA (guanine-N(1)-)-methyltransferase n=1 Tax=Catalinimonas alkaloidigena TaxID=1075417 RepID=A0A1G9M2I3_9BACT|nr:tRNA (guanosine(37)-N1)-methyltransferase TrmD [Catalinimonas alkaloidigena]SDL68479.1 tRNA (guanine37-N1)-methyltransferase [Catalinimonas alkaloidigena]
MRLDIITCLPKILESPFDQSILKRAQQKGLVEVHVHDLRDYSPFKHRQVDDYAYGGGAGMVLMTEPIARCIRHLSEARNYDAVVYMTPDGKRFDQPMANQLSLLKNIILLCGHYKGVDERIREKFVTHEISIGDYVLSGGELAAAVVADALIRLLPGVLSDETSALTDSFQDGLLAPPVYTRPADFEGMRVPDILLSGHEAAIEQWRYDQALARTRERRPDLLKED